MDTVLKAENVVPLPVNLVGKDIRAARDKNDFRCDELLQALPAAVYTTDAAGRITFYNEAAAALWGYRPELGKSE